MASYKRIWISTGIAAMITFSLFGEQTPPVENVAADEANLVAQISPLVETASDPLPARDVSSPAKNVTVGSVSAVPSPTPSPNVVINLIHRLVQRGVLTQADADELIKQAEADAAKARAIATNEKTQPVRTDEGAPQLFAEPSPLPQNFASSEPQPPAASPELGDSADEENSVNVTYVPEVVKQQLREEIREEVMEKAREENWANPRLFPSWVLRFKPFADVRLRYEGSFFPSGNDNSGAFPNFNAINTGPPFDVTGTTFSPQLNVDKDRERGRIRVRGGAEMDLEDGFTIGVRIATGETNTPTSTNQTFGAANNAQGGNFSKYAIWLDRGFVRYELGGKPSDDFVAEVGRFDNPYFTISELIWDVDLGWDGLAVAGKHQVAEGVTTFATLGIFPVFNTDFNFSTNQPAKFTSEDKWLYGGQAGVNWRMNKEFSLKVAGAFYDFENIEGQLSKPFVPLTSSDQGNTDDSRPSFAQKGNTYFPIRHILPTVDNNFGTTKQFQYFGLATPFQVVDFNGTLDYSHFDPVHLTLFGEWLENVALDINPLFVNNQGPNRSSGRRGTYAGGNVGWIVGLKVGRPALEKRWDWSAGIDYRYVESDATVDAFNDSDFGGGGTNLKGYTVFGQLALSKRVSVVLRWMSAEEIGGPTYRNNILQFDFNAKF